MKNSILAAASKRFARYGFYKTTIEDIASDLNKVKSSLYYYFKTKEEIFKAVMEAELEEFAGALRESVEKESSPKEKLRVFICSHLKIFLKLMQGYCTLSEIYFSKHETVEDLRNVFDKREIALVEKIIEDGNKNKEFNAAEPRSCAYVILTAIKGAEQQYFENKNSKNTLTLSKTLADILVRGISR
ncbi:TetR/AcrR family transcriptional regulator [Endomicrobium proavitum]|uniref:Putative Transcriptional regulator n=1 Tax=Endomicrobium proavitum TaxID=1408281 RepID=A0A0G3WJ54_9BACT|nr:TetR/AcrR family transcriptional regulator [Endomicrobium proavitum]AKL98358.1 putative Transcriptional regulator [Endomicrobium proavitum]